MEPGNIETYAPLGRDSELRLTPVAANGKKAAPSTHTEGQSV